MTWASYLLLLFGLSWAFIGFFRWYAISKGMIDVPNDRSSHYEPVPRGGGIILCLGWAILVGIFYYYQMLAQQYIWYFLPVLIVGLLGFWDDQKGLSASFRFVVQVLCAMASLLVTLEGGGIVQSWFSTIPLPVCFLISAFVIVWMVNLFNFMDGSDGMAATQAIFIFGIGGYILFQVHAVELATLAWGLVALLGGFLTWNWPTARIFMGDSGSCFLGFLIALYALISYKLFDVPLAVWIILTGLFWFDATITLLRRMFAGEDWRKPHRMHAYQRLIQGGWSHQRVLLGAIFMNSLLSGLALLAFKEPRLLTFSLGLSIALLSCAYLMCELYKPMFKKWHEA